MKINDPMARGGVADAVQVDDAADGDHLGCGGGFTVVAVMDRTVLMTPRSTMSKSVHVRTISLSILLLGFRDMDMK